jgi:DNA-directed RNA polymerase subunit F
MICSPNDVQNHYIAYQLIQEWLQKKQKEKERFTNQEIAEKYLRKWSFLERLCAECTFNDCTARYHAAKEYLKENKY